MHECENRQVIVNDAATPQLIPAMGRNSRAFDAAPRSLGGDLSSVPTEGSPDMHGDETLLELDFDLHQGFARVRYPDCQHEMCVAFSRK